MAKRRGHGEGSIFRRKDGRWCAAITVGRDAKGRLRRKYIYGRSREEVRDELIKNLADRQNGLPVDPARQTVGQFLESWLEDCVKGSVRPYTYRSYAQMVKHLAPIASIPPAKLTPQQVQKLYKAKQEQGLTRTVVLMHGVLRKALNQAVKWGLVPRNVVALVDPPRVPKKEFRPLTPEEAVKFLEAAAEDRFHALYVLAIACGLRLEELLGLRWEDLDMEKRTLTVRHQLQYAGGKPVLTEPKTPRARRTVHLPDVALTALKKHRIRQLEERLRAGDAWQDWGLVFASEVGTPLSPSNIRNRSFHQLLKRANLPPVRFHDLRHTCATLLLAQGVHPKLVQEQLGHSEISMTLDLYSHVMPSMMKEAAAKMDEILTAAPAPGRPHP